MIEWVELNEEDERFIDNPGFSEDQEPDPECVDMFWDEVEDYIHWWRQEERAYYEEMNRNYWTPGGCYL